MDLWIRSQNKEVLTQIDNVCLDEFVNYKGIDIITKIKPTDKSGILGTYKTKERALEVLDEIQGLLIPKATLISNKDLEGNDIKVYGAEYIGSYVYEMPKE